MGLRVYICALIVSATMFAGVEWVYAQSGYVESHNVQFGAGGVGGNEWAADRTLIEPTPGRCIASLQSDLPAALGITLYLKDPDGEVVAQENQTSWTYYLAVNLTGSMTLTGRYTCEAHFWYEFEYLGTDREPFSVRLRAYTITLDSFIPHDNREHPFWPDITYKGDDRWHWSPYGDFRTRVALRILGSAAVSPLDGGPWRETGASSVYQSSSSLDGSGRLTAEALNDWEPGSPLKIDWDQAPTSGMPCNVNKTSVTELNIHCSGSVPNTLVWSWNQWAATVTYDITIRLTFSGDGNVYYEVTGEHDGAPNHGVWVGDRRIYDYDYRGQSFFSLGPPMEMTAYRSGVL